MRAILAAIALVLACNSGSDSGGVGIPGVKSAQASCIEETKGDKGKGDKGDRDCLPGVTFVDMDGRAITPDDLRGKVVAVNFWATWCPPCKAEIPALTRFYEKHKDRGFVLLGVMADEMTLPELEEFSKQYGLRYPVIKLDYEVGDHFGLPAGFPTTYVYDRTGHLRFEERKAINEAKFGRLLEELLAEPAS